MADEAKPAGWMKCPRVVHRDNPDGWIFAKMHDERLWLVHRWVGGRFVCLDKVAERLLGLMEPTKETSHE